MEADVLAPQASFFRRTFASLHFRNFRLFFFGQIVSNSGNWLTMVALVLLVLDRTGSGVAVGLLSACQFGPILLFSAWGGVLVDRFNKRKLLYITQSLEMAQSFVLAGLAFMHDRAADPLLHHCHRGGLLPRHRQPGAAVDGERDGAGRRRAERRDAVQRDDQHLAHRGSAHRRRAGGQRRLRLVLHARRAVVHHGARLALDDASVRDAPAAHHPRAPGQIRAGLRYILTVPDLWIPFAMLLIIGTISYNFSVVLPLFIVKGLHENRAAYTYVYAAFSTGGLLGALLVARRSTVVIRTVAMGAVGLGVTMLVLSASPNLMFAVVVALAVGASSIAYMTATTSIAQLRTSREMIGRVLSIQTVLLIGTTPIGGPILGLLADSVGPRFPIFLGGIGALVAAAFGVLTAPRCSRWFDTGASGARRRRRDLVVSLSRGRCSTPPRMPTQRRSQRQRPWPSPRSASP